MTITLTEDMAYPTTDISDVLLERWLDPVLFFGLQIPDTIVYNRSEAFVDFNFTFLFIHVKVKLKSTKASERL